MKYVIVSLLLIMWQPAIAAPQTKKVCHLVSNAAHKSVTRCKIITIHKKLNGTTIPIRKK